MSNKKRIERAIDEFTCNALLLKVKTSSFFFLVYIYKCSISLIIFFYLHIVEYSHVLSLSIISLILRGYGELKLKHHTDFFLHPFWCKKHRQQ